MDVYEFFREYERMLKTDYDCDVITDVRIISDAIANNKEKVLFDVTVTKEKIDKVIEWSKNHPRKTRLQDFKEKYPNADAFEDGTPKVCASLLGYCEKCAIVGDYSRDCDACWNEPVQ